jgi:phosphoenolpyruvate carboxykinase (ATP)
MFIKPKTNEEYRRHVPEFTVIAVPLFKAFPQIDSTPTNTFIVINLTNAYVSSVTRVMEGDQKPFTLLNYLSPMQGIMTMHCSANTGKEWDTALFFGLWY